MRIAVWNVRGVGAMSKKKMVKTLIKEESIDIIGLVETKHRSITAKDMNYYWENHDSEWMPVPTKEGGSGGIILTLIKDSFLLME